MKFISRKTSKFWLFALPASLLFLVAAYYIKVPSARRFIDAHTSLGRQLFGSFVHDTVVVEIIHRPERSGDSRGGGGLPPSTAGNAPPAAMPPTPTPVPVYDFKKVAADPSLWPKKVVLKREVTFPAVVGGKVVGSVKVPAGAEANLKMIKDGKVWVEYQGGGAGLAEEDTDLKARVMAR